MERSLNKLSEYFDKLSENIDNFVITIDCPGCSGKSVFTEKPSKLLND